MYSITCITACMLIILLYIRECARHSRYILYIYLCPSVLFCFIPSSAQHLVCSIPRSIYIYNILCYIMHSYRRKHNIIGTYTYRVRSWE